MLLVDDDELGRIMLKAFLDRAKMIVTTANNGSEAVAATLTERFDMILMDMQMPVMDGVSATMEIRKRPSESALPIICISANVLHEGRDLCAQAGINDFVYKPIDIDALWSVLLRWT